MSSVERESLRGILELPYRFNELSIKDQVVYYLKTSPYASWEHIGGRLLLYGENAVLQVVKKHIKPEKGRW